MGKAKPQSAYNTRIERVLNYIHNHLDDQIDLDVLSDVACMSRFHWHRTYTAMQGETIATTVRRLRLARAADRLANSNMELADIASHAGYTTAEAFGRAFKEAYQQPPMSYREGGSHAQFKAANKTGDARGFPIAIEELLPLRCAAKTHSGSYMRIDQAMGQLFSALGGSGLLNRSTRMIGLFLDDPDRVETDALRSMACSPLPTDAQVPAGLEAFTLHGGPYAKLRYKGPYADMKDAYRWFFGVWLPTSGREAADAPILEEYLNNPAMVSPTELLTDICLPLEP